ncbi:hypothetical protein EDB87DRAFT_405645 [Lactarius vividus]|nr:hypothetical protein EDB87DRAFT_405645 [Lactarius vividus]
MRRRPASGAPFLLLFYPPSCLATRTIPFPLAPVLLPWLNYPHLASSLDSHLGHLPTISFLSSTGLFRCRFLCIYRIEERRVATCSPPLFGVILARVRALLSKLLVTVASFCLLGQQFFLVTHSRSLQPLAFSFLLSLLGGGTHPTFELT